MEFTELKKGRDYFLARDILAKVVESQELSLKDGTMNSGSVKEYMLTPELLDFLAERGIRRKCDVSEDVFVLVDYNQQEEPIPGWACSNGWLFQKNRNELSDLKISISIEFRMDEKKRHVILFPITSASVSPSNTLPNFRMFKALVEFDLKPLEIFKKISGTPDGRLEIGWDTVGFGGARKLSDIFKEFCDNKKLIEILGRKDSGVFDPDPSMCTSGNQIFISANACLKIIRIWKRQFNYYVTYLKTINEEMKL